MDKTDIVYYIPVRFKKGREKITGTTGAYFDFGSS